MLLLGVILPVYQAPTGAAGELSFVSKGQLSVPTTYSTEKYPGHSAKSTGSMIQLSTLALSVCGFE